MVAWPAAPARATCDPPAGNNVTATCTGTTTDQNTPNGYGTGTETNLSTTVVTGASVSGTTSGIFFDTGSVTNFGTITGGFDGIRATTATVNNSGTITGTSSAGIEATTATVTNSGTIAGGFDGIRADTATVTNSGTITGGFDGINASIATVTNSGTIAGGIEGILANTATVTNSGSITGGLVGIEASIATVTNSSSITGGLAGIEANTATVTNFGTITGGLVGIEASTATVTNSGSIAGGNFGIDAGTANVTNSGRISGGTAALNFFGGNADTLTLLPGSTIVGAINLGGGGDTVNFRTGNQNLTFDTLAGATVTSTVPFAVAGNQVATIDPTPFAVLDRNLMDFSRAVSQALPDDAGFAGTGLAGAAAGPATAFAAASPLGEAVIPGLSAYAADAAGIFKAPTARYGDGTRIWARGFAGERVQEADGSLLHTVNRIYGGMLGGDWQAWSDWRLGAFVGAGEIRSSVDFNYGETRSTLAFGGLYGRHDWGPWFLRLAVQGGHSSNDVDRTINNNLVLGGIERATGSFAGWYVSPEASVGFHHGLGTFGGASYMLTPSLSLRYVHASFDGYTESGTTAPLTVGRRVVDDFEQRGEVKLSRTQVFGGTAALTTSIFGGVLGQERAGDTTVAATLLGQAIPFALPGKDTVWGGYGGAGLVWQSGPVSLFASAQYLGLSDSSSLVSGQGGIRIAF